jgi:hypothetical protein
MSHPLPLHRHWRFRRLAEYLAAKAPPGRLPGRRHIEPCEIVDLLPYLMLLDVVAEFGGEPRFRIRLAGTEVVRSHGSEVTGRFVDEVLHGPPKQEIGRRYREIVRTRTPQFYRGRVAAPGRGHIGYERVTFPLAADGERVDMLISVFAILSAREAAEAGPPDGAHGIGAHG